MLKQDNKDYIYVIWKEPVSRRQFIIGELVKNGKYEFFYGHEVINAIEKGFDLLIEFDDLEKVYYCDELFPTFASRLPDKRRRGVKSTDKLYLELEPSNKYDKFAIQVINSNKEILGYIPRYYSENLSNFIKNGYKYDLMASLVNKNKNCNECIKVKLKIKKD